MSIIIGEVISGEKIGRTLGFPTANVQTKTKLALETGVYVCMAYLPYFDSETCEHLELDNNPAIDISPEKVKAAALAKEELQEKLTEYGQSIAAAHSTAYPGLLHYGPRSTFSDNKDQVEVYLYNFDYLIYGETMIVDVREKLRDSLQFPTPDALVKQMLNDKVHGAEIINAS